MSLPGMGLLSGGHFFYPQQLSSVAFQVDPASQSSQSNAALCALKGQ